MVVGVTKLAVCHPQDIMGPCEQALDKLGAGKAMAPRRTADQAK